MRIVIIGVTIGAVCLIIGFFSAYWWHKAVVQNVLPGEAHACCAKERKYYDGVAEKIIFQSRTSEDDATIIEREGLLVVKPHARATVLICHGFMCSKHDVGFLRDIFRDFNTFTFDFRAHGERSSGQICTFGRDEQFDVIGAAHILHQHAALKDKPLLVYGFSMGSVATICALAREQDLFDAAVLDCPFDSSDAIIRRSIDKLTFSVAGFEFGLPGKDLLKKYAYNSYVQSFIKHSLKTVAKMDTLEIETNIVPLNTVEFAKKITIPAFFIACKNDDRAPVEAVKAVYDAALGIKRLWITNGRRHFDSFFYNPEKYRFKINHFVTNVLDGKFTKKKKEKITQDGADQTYLINNGSVPAAK
jgi:hypothetical protein